MTPGSGELPAPTIYLDANATTQPLPEVVDAVAGALRSAWANPSSVHRPGMEARYAVERARAAVSTLVGASERGVVFTSGATESIATAIIGCWRAAGGDGLVVTTATEHAAVHGACAVVEALRGQVVRVPVARDGLVDMDVLERVLRTQRVAVLSVALANNETGVMQDVAAIAALAKAIQATTLVHTDATQAVGKVPVDMPALGVDLLSCSAHKLHGPKGVGALVVKPGVVVPPLLEGAQERGRRGGTEAVPAIVGFGVAAEAARRWFEGWAGESAGPPAAAIRGEMERRLLADLAGTGAVIHGAAAPRLWNTTSLGIAGLEAEAILLWLSERGVAVGAGAACSSGSLEPSPTIRAMGVSEEFAHGTIRLSLSRFTTLDEALRGAGLVVEAVRALSRVSPRPVVAARLPHADAS